MLVENGYFEDSSANETDSGIFNPPIDVILWRRERVNINDDDEDEDHDQDQEEQLNSLSRPRYEYYVKFKEYSYLHCEWVDEIDIISMGKLGKNRLQRFNKQFDKQARDGVYILIIKRSFQ